MRQYAAKLARKLKIVDVENEARSLGIFSEFVVIRVYSCTCANPIPDSYVVLPHVQGGVGKNGGVVLVTKEGHKRTLRRSMVCSDRNAESFPPGSGSTNKSGVFREARSGNGASEAYHRVQSSIVLR